MMNRVNEIDLLRFIAAICVVFFHYTFRGYAADNYTIVPYLSMASYSKYGYLGVELFFMISGFVILMTVSNANFKSFIVSRFVRLYPAFWAGCTITFITILTIGEPRFDATLSQYIINMSLLNGFLGIPSIDGVYWSLFIEMQFYALIGIVLLLNKIDKIELLLFFWIVLSILFVFFPLSKLINYILIVNYSTYFISGAVFYLVWCNGFTKRRIIILILSMSLAIYQAVTELASFEKKYNTDMNPFVVAGIIILLFIIMLLISIRRTGKFGRTQWLLAGALTYPLYLLHQNIGYMIFNIGYSIINKYVLLWGTIALVLGLAYFIHISIEKKYSSSLKSRLNYWLNNQKVIK